MNETTVVLGFGVVGRAVVQLLLARRERVLVAQRKRPADLPPGVEFRTCDILDEASVHAAVRGTERVVIAIGLPYDAAVWRATWPPAMRHLVAACAGAKTVFVDNLYQLGPQDAPRREDMALTSAGRKPAILSEVTRIWQAAVARTGQRFAALRCPDFYGPGVAVSHLGTSGIGAVACGQAALLITPPDVPHDFVFVPDVARAVLALLDAPDDAFGQAWNAPCAPTRTPRQILQLAADAAGERLRVRALPVVLLPVLGLFSKMMREFSDVRFTLDRPYVVDSGKFTRRFRFSATPYETGVRETALAFRASRGGVVEARA